MGPQLFAPRALELAILPNTGSPIASWAITALRRESRDSSSTVRRDGQLRSSTLRKVRTAQIVVTDFAAGTELGTTGGDVLAIDTGKGSQSSRPWHPVSPHAHTSPGLQSHAVGRTGAAGTVLASLATVGLAP